MLFSGKWRSELKTVKVTRRVGEDEILEITFNERSIEGLLRRVGQVLDFLMTRMEDRNKKVLSVAESLQPKPGPRRA